MSNHSPLRIVFMGTPDFAVPCLQALLDRPELANVVAVYTQPDRPAGRGLELKEPPVKTLATKYGLPVLQPENINKDGEPRRLADFMPDVAVVVAYAQFLGPAVLNTPRLGCINVHGSLLPKYRGAAPIQYAVLNGDDEIGVTTIKLIQKMDAGPMLVKKSMPLPPNATSADMFAAVAPLGAQALIETLLAMQNNTLTESAQNERAVSFAPMITKEMGLIDWQEQAHTIHNKVRGLQTWPGAYAMTSHGKIKVIKTSLPQDLSDVTQGNTTPGNWIHCSKGILVRAKDGWVKLDVVQLEGKKALPTEHFLNGIQNSKVPFKFITQG